MSSSVKVDDSVAPEREFCLPVTHVVVLRKSSDNVVTMFVDSSYQVIGDPNVEGSANLAPENIDPIVVLGRHLQ